MTTWTIDGPQAKARCRGFDIHARWGTGQDYIKTISERPSSTPGAERPEEDAQGIIIHVTSPHRKVDNVIMLQAVPQDPEQAIRTYTGGTSPESLIPTYRDWTDEWSWLADYRDKARWKRTGNQATAFMGHLNLTVKLTTMEDALKRMDAGAQPGHAYGSNVDLNTGGKGFESNTQVFIAELREDLDLIAVMITKTSDEQAPTLKDYTKVNDPAIVVTRCLVTVYQNTGTQPPHR